MFRKTESMSISEFMNGKHRTKTSLSKKIVKSSTLIPVLVAGHSLPAFAAGPDVVTASAASVVGEKMRETVIHAFEPIVEVISALAYPIAMIMITGGALFIMIGNREKGFDMMAKAGIGYICVQLAPLLMKLLVEIGNNV